MKKKKKSHYRTRFEEVLRMEQQKDIEGLIAALDDPTEVALKPDNVLTIRDVAAWMLGKLGDTRATHPLVALLHDRNERVRISAMAALRKLRDPRAVPALIEALEDGRGGWQAVAALRKIADPRAFDALVKALSVDEWWVRQEAARALAALGDTRAIEPIEEARARESFRRKWAYLRPLRKLKRRL